MKTKYKATVGYPSTNIDGGQILFKEPLLESRRSIDYERRGSFNPFKVELNLSDRFVVDRDICV